MSENSPNADQAPTTRRVIVIFAALLIAFVAGVLVAMSFGDNSEPSAQETETPVEPPEPEVQDPSEPAELTPEDPSNDGPEHSVPPEPEQVPEVSDLTQEQVEALESAQATLDAVPIGRAHLIDLLENAGHDLDDAVRAIAALKVDWEGRALEAAESIIEHTPSSKEGLVDHLERIGFTSDQASGSVEKLDTDWDEQARILAKQYHDTFRFDRDRLIFQLLSEGFTQTQAEAAASGLGL